MSSKKHLLIIATEIVAVTIFIFIAAGSLSQVTAGERAVSDTFTHAVIAEFATRDG